MTRTATRGTGAPTRILAGGRTTGSVLGQAVGVGNATGWDWDFELQLSAATVGWSAVRGCRVNYGTEDLWGDVPNAGTMLITLDNSDGSFTPRGGGTHADEKWFGQRCFLQADKAGRDWGLEGPPVILDGIVTDVTFDFPDAFDATVTLVVSDRLGVLAGADYDLDGASYSDVQAWLDAYVSTPTFTNLAQQSTVNITAVGATPTSSAVAWAGPGGGLLAVLAHTEGGTITCRQGITPAGFPTTSANELWLRPRAQVAPFATIATFADDGTPGAFKMSEVEIAYAGTDLVTSYRLTREGGTVQTGSDDTAVAAYGDRVLERSGLFNATDNDVDGLGQRALLSRAEPLIRVRRVTTDLIEEDDATAEQVLKTSTLDRVDVRFTPVGASQITYSGVVVGVSWDFTPPRYARATFSLVDLADFAGFLLDDAVFGTLDDGNRLG